MVIISVPDLETGGALLIALAVANIILLVSPFAIGVLGVLQAVPEKYRRWFFSMLGLRRVPLSISDVTIDGTDPDADADGKDLGSGAGLDVTQRADVSSPEERPNDQSDLVAATDDDKPDLWSWDLEEEPRGRDAAAVAGSSHQDHASSPHPELEMTDLADENATLRAHMEQLQAEMAALQRAEQSAGAEALPSLIGNVLFSAPTSVNPLQG